MKAVVYKIENLLTSDCYIGSTTNYCRRKKRHFEDLKRGNHHSIKLQRAVNKYKIDVFRMYELEIFEFISKPHLLEREQHYIDVLNPKYNMCKIAGNQLGSIRSKAFKQKCSERMRGKTAWNKGLILPKHSKETIEKRAKSLTGRLVSIDTRLRIKEKVSRPILQYGNDGGFIKEWPSAKEAAKVLRISYPRLIEYLNGKSNITTFKNFIWKKKLL